MARDTSLPLAAGARGGIISPDVDASVRFFTEVAGLDETGRDGSSALLRAWGDYFHHSLKITKGPTPALGHLGWRADVPRLSPTS